MAPNQKAVDRLVQALRLTTPILALYDDEPGPAFEPMVEAAGRACCFAYYRPWLEGKTLVIRRAPEEEDVPSHGCPGAQRALGLHKTYPDYMAHFLTDGGGAPMGEGLKASPEIAQEFLDRAKPPKVSGDTILIGPLRLERWEKTRSLTFLVDPDRLSALLTLAAWWTSDPGTIHAPFSSGCGLLWRELETYPGDHAVLGCTDIAMRRYVPPEILCLSVTPGHFETMLGYPDDAFLNREWWGELLKHRGLG